MHMATVSSGWLDVAVSVIGEASSSILPWQRYHTRVKTCAKASHPMPCTTNIIPPSLSSWHTLLCLSAGPYAALCILLAPSPGGWICLLSFHPPPGGILITSRGARIDCRMLLPRPSSTAACSTQVSRSTCPHSRESRHVLTRADSHKQLNAPLTPSFKFFVPFLRHQDIIAAFHPNP